jgi:hypothetical protein
MCSGRINITTGTRYLCSTLLLLLVLNIGVLAVQPSARSVATMADILRDRVIWGRDFNWAVRGVTGWAAVRIQTVNIYRDRIEGTDRAFSTRSAALQMAQTSLRATIKRRLLVAPHFESLLANSTAVPFHADVDGNPELGFKPNWKGGEYLASNVTIRVLKERFGEGSIVTHTTPSVRLERPAMSTDYIYADGRVTFRLSDNSEQPDIVQYVSLSVATVTATAFVSK